MQKFAIKEKSILLVHSAGAAYTNDIICKYRFYISPMCPFCDQLDSRSHRLKNALPSLLIAWLTPFTSNLERMHPIAIEFGLEYVPHGVWQLWEKLQNRKLDHQAAKGSYGIYSLHRRPKKCINSFISQSFEHQKRPIYFKKYSGLLSPRT